MMLEVQHVLGFLDNRLYRIFVSTRGKREDLYCDLNIIDVRCRFFVVMREQL